MKTRRATLVALLLTTGATVTAQPPPAIPAAPAERSDTAAWRDPSKHEVQFVTVEDQARLEVLDWGGSGRAIVLLAGSGNSAHVFDDFAAKLRDWGHVYGITRRGYGASSQPPSGYDDQRLADDVLRVLNSLRINAPVLVGHSMAGGELTTLGNQHSDRLAGLVYLDALGDARDWPASDPAYMALVRKLPAPPQTCPSPAWEKLSFAAFRAWQMCTQRFSFPESELRSTSATSHDGTMGPQKTPRRIHDAIGAGQKRRDYANIRVPVLAIFEFPLPPDAPTGPNEDPPRNEEERGAISAFRSATKSYVDRWVANLKRGVPDARLVDLPGAGHYVFLTREAEVLEEIRAFVERLPRRVNRQNSSLQHKERRGSSIRWRGPRPRSGSMSRAEEDVCARASTATLRRDSAA